MAKLKLSGVDDDRPVRIAIDMPAALHRDLVAYGEAIALQEGGKPIEPVKLIVPMLQRFIATDRGFASVKNGSKRKTP